MGLPSSTTTKNFPRILHVINLNTVGGVEQLFAHFLEHTIDPAHGVHSALLMGDRIHPYFRTCCDERLESFRSAKHFGIVKIPKVPSGLRVRKVEYVLNRFRPDVCLIWNRFADPTLRAAFERAKTECVYYEEGSAWLASPDRSADNLLPVCSRAMAASRAAARVLELRWAYKGEIVTFPNGIRPDVVPAKAPARELPENRPLRLGMAARLIPLKAPETALETVKRLEERGVDCTLHLAGDGPLLPRLKKRASTLNIAGRCVFHGLIEDMASFYDEIDLLLVPSVREPFGMVASEAAVRGCPAIVARVDGLPEVVEHGMTGYTLSPKVALKEAMEPGDGDSEFPEFVYDPDSDRLQPPRFLDPADVADHIVSLTASPETYASMSKRGAQRAREEFGFDRYVERLTGALIRKPNS